MKRRRLICVVSDIDKSLHFEWICQALNARFDLSFILIGSETSALGSFLERAGIPVTIIKCRSKSDLVRAWFTVVSVFVREKPDIVHTHLWIANLVGLSAAWAARVPRRLYTRHHGNLHYTTHRSGLKWDRLNNRIATDIIAISENIRDLLIRQDGADPQKVVLIRHGFDFSYFYNVEPARIELLRRKYRIPSGSQPVIGAISRFIEWKGVQYIIPAYEKVLESYPDAHLILANARGSYEGEISTLLSRLPAASFTCIPFEEDLAALYRLFDIFVHVPTDPAAEAFGQTYVEPLILGIPCVFTRSGVAQEFIAHGKNAFVVDHGRSDQVFTGIMRLLRDQGFRAAVIDGGRQSVKDFTMENYLARLTELYEGQRS